MTDKQINYEVAYWRIIHSMALAENGGDVTDSIFHSLRQLGLDIPEINELGEWTNYAETKLKELGYKERCNICKNNPCALVCSAQKFPSEEFIRDEAEEVSMDSYVKFTQYLNQELKAEREKVKELEVNIRTLKTIIKGLDQEIQGLERGYSNV